MDARLSPQPGFEVGTAGGTAPRRRSLFCKLYFTMTGVHALHLAVGVVWMGSAAWGRAAPAGAVDPASSSSLFLRARQMPRWLCASQEKRS
jgi:hypothetical protein